LLLYICDLVKLHVAFFFSVLPFMVNKDEYNFRQDDVGGRARVTTDKERVAYQKDVERR